MSHRDAHCPLATASADLRAMSAAVLANALDDAIACGLLTYVAIAERGDIDRDAVCAECAEHDRVVVPARDARLRALAARERFRARQTRLQRRAEARANRRAAAPATAAAIPATGSTTETTAHSAPRPALPAAAAAALARAKAKAAAGRGPRE